MRYLPFLTAFLIAVSVIGISDYRTIQLDDNSSYNEDYNSLYNKKTSIENYQYFEKLKLEQKRYFNNN